MDFHWKLGQKYYKFMRLKRKENFDFQTEINKNFLVHSENRSKNAAA